MAMKHGTKLSSQFELFLHRLSGKREKYNGRMVGDPRKTAQVGWLAGIHQRASFESYRSDQRVSLPHGTLGMSLAAHDAVHVVLYDAREASGVDDDAVQYADTPGRNEE